MKDKNKEFHQEQEKRFKKIRKSANRDKQIADHLRRQGNHSAADRKMRDYDHAVSLLENGIGAERPVLSNIVMAALADPKRGIYGYQHGKYAESMRRNIQSQLATCQKFFVSNSLLEHAYMASMSKPKTLVNMLYRAKPCFSNMWIEWDEDYRRKIINREMEKLGIINDEHRPDWIDRVGYHIMTMGGKPMFTNYMAASSTHEKRDEDDAEPRQVMAMPIGFFMSNDGPILRDDLNGFFPEESIDHDTFELDMDNTASGLMGRWYLDKWKTKGSIDPYLERCFVQVQGAPMHWSIPARKFDAGWTAEEMNALKGSSLLSQSGDGRFLIALLGMLNYDLIKHETIQPAQQIDHIRFGRKVPKNEYSVVSIDLPKPRGKRIYDQMFTGHGSPKREHWRRGHWRTLKDARGNIKKRVWIEEMKVGDPSLGTITHDYELRSKSS